MSGPTSRAKRVRRAGLFALIVAAIAQRFRIEWGVDRPIPMASITLRPTGGLRAVVRQRG